MRKSRREEIARQATYLAGLKHELDCVRSQHQRLMINLGLAFNTEEQALNTAADAIDPGWGRYGTYRPEGYKVPPTAVRLRAQADRSRAKRQPVRKGDR